MCESASAAVYCVGYVLPVSCCMAGACMSCYGCYRYYKAGDVRRRRLQRVQRDVGGFPEVFPRIKRDTLKRKMTKAFAKAVSSNKAGRKPEVPTLDLNEHVLKDLRDACAICMESYEPQPSATVFVGLVKTCGHYFHFDCIWSWLELNQTCPICRVNCDLSDSDLQGLSLQQVLDMFLDLSVKHGHVSIKGDNVNLHGSKSNPNIVDIGEDDQYECEGRTVSLPARDMLARRVTVATVITSQPRAVVVNKTKSTSLIDRLKQRFEGGEHRDENQQGQNNRTVSDLETQGHANSDVEGQGHPTIDLEAQGQSNPSFE